MTGGDFYTFRQVRKLTQKQAAEAIGCSKSAIEKWEADPAKELPLYIALACAAVVRNVKPWRPA